MITHIRVSDDGLYKFEYECAKSPIGSHDSVHSMEDEEFVRRKLFKIKEGDVVIDVGANYGSYTLWALARGAGFVLAFEPNEFLYNSLKNNIELNNWYLRTNVYKKGLWNDEGLIKYSMNKLSTVIAGQNDKIEKIEITTLDKFIQQIRFEKIDWIKIDVDGGELEVLQGAIETIKKYKPRLLIELHNFIDKDIWAKIVEYLNERLGSWSWSFDGPYPWVNGGETSHVVISLLKSDHMDQL
jgi:FkbM family methyltransferase